MKELLSKNDTHWTEEWLPKIIFFEQKKDCQKMIAIGLKNNCQKY